MRTTMRLDGHMAVLGAGGTLIIEQPSIRLAGGRLIIVYHCLHRPCYLA